MLVMAVIFFLSSQSSGKSEDLSDAFAGILNLEHTDKTTRVSNQNIFLGLTLRKFAHIILFAALGFCLCNAFTDIRYRILWSVGSSYVYAVLDEIHQSFTKRFGRWQDTLIDMIGIVIGISASILFMKLCRRIRKQINSKQNNEKYEKTDNSCITINHNF